MMCFFYCSLGFLDFLFHTGNDLWDRNYNDKFPGNVIIILDIGHEGKFGRMISNDKTIPITSLPPSLGLLVLYCMDETVCLCRIAGRLRELN